MSNQRVTDKPLSDCYRPVRITGSIRIHALWEGEDKTMCGHVESLNVEGAAGYSVGCGECQAALKKERQRRSAEGAHRGEERRLAAHYRAEDERRLEEQERETAEQAAYEDATALLLKVKDQASSNTAKAIIRAVLPDNPHALLRDLKGKLEPSRIACNVAQLVLDLGQRAMQPAMGLAPGNYGNFTVNPPPTTPRPPAPRQPPAPVHSGAHVYFDREGDEAFNKDCKNTSEKLAHLIDADKNAYVLAVNLKRSSVMNAPMFGKTVQCCTYCLAVRGEDDIIYNHEHDCPVILADQVIENYGGGK